MVVVPLRFSWPRELPHEISVGRLHHSWEPLTSSKMSQRSNKLFYVVEFKCQVRRIVFRTLAVASYITNAEMERTLKPYLVHLEYNEALLGAYIPSHYNICN